MERELGMGYVVWIGVCGVVDGEFCCYSLGVLQSVVREGVSVLGSFEGFAVRSM